MRYTREEACLAWLTHGGLPCDGLHALLESASAEAIYERFTEDRSFMKAYAPRECIMELARHAPPAAMHEMLVTMQAHDMHVMHMGDARYPALLREISDPPAILFYAGDPSCLHDPCVTMVGTRNASAHGLRTAHDVARDLAKAGVTVVSGFAVGVDSACHTGCMDGGGRTAAVLGCGLDVAYPAGSEALRRRILDTGGVLLTEFPPGAPPSGWHFPVRNRILSGLSRATIMMECRERSGSMNTVQHALDQGREVYAYPGRTGTPAASGAHILLRSEPPRCGRIAAHQLFAGADEDSRRPHCGRMYP